jgi:hypothetical protein
VAIERGIRDNEPRPHSGTDLVAAITPAHGGCLTTTRSGEGWKVVKVATEHALNHEDVDADIKKLNELLAPPCS